MRELFEPNTLSDNELGALLAEASIIDRWCKKLYAISISRAQQNHQIAGQKLVLTSRPRRWLDQVAAAAELRRAGVPEDKLYVRNLISITEAEAILGKGHPVIAKYAEKPEGNPTLAPLSDPREPITSSRSDTLAAFGNKSEDDEIEDF